MRCLRELVNIVQAINLKPSAKFDNHDTSSWVATDINKCLGFCAHQKSIQLLILYVVDPRRQRLVSTHLHYNHLFRRQLSQNIVDMIVLAFSLHLRLHFNNFNAIIFITLSAIDKVIVPIPNMHQLQYQSFSSQLFQQQVYINSCSLDSLDRTNLDQYKILVH